MLANFFWLFLLLHLLVLFFSLFKTTYFSIFFQPLCLYPCVECNLICYEVLHGQDTVSQRVVDGTVVLLMQLSLAYEPHPCKSGVPLTLSGVVMRMKADQTSVNSRD